jgi:hypothetical protein
MMAPLSQLPYLQTSKILLRIDVSRPRENKPYQLTFFLIFMNDKGGITEYLHNGELEMTQQMAALKAL